MPVIQLGDNRMKIRQGFVSNSSSSSFILEIISDENEACPHCGRKDPDFIDLLDKQSRMDDYETQTGEMDYIGVITELEKSKIL